MRYDAVIAGYIGVDLAPEFPSASASASFTELFQPGKLLQTGKLSVSLGGVVPNTGLGMRKFGKNVNLMGLVGNDMLGDIVVEKLREHGEVSGIRRIDKAGTAYGIVLAPPGTDRMFLEYPGCNALLTADMVDLGTVTQSRLFHFGYPPLMERMFENGGAELVRLLKHVHDLGVAVSLDMSLPDPDSPAGKADWRGILATCLPHVDVFVPSIEEILFMMAPNEYANIRSQSDDGDIIDHVPPDLYNFLGDAILNYGVKILLVKAGHKGAYLRTGDVGDLNARTALSLPCGNWSRRDAWIPPFSVDPSRVRNACGAGDCAVAGFLAAILEGVEIEAAGKYAMLAGRDNLYGVDALCGLSDWGSMTAIVSKSDELNCGQAPHCKGEVS